MEKKDILLTIEKVRKDERKRNFKQTFDFILNLKDMNIKQQKVDIFILLPHERTVKKTKVCALVDDSIAADAKKVCDLVINKDDFPRMAKEKRKMKKIAAEYGFFITQPHLMAEIATHFGKILGPKGKMPNPKAGCVIPPKVPLQPIVDRLRKTIRLQTKADAIIKCSVGDEESKDDNIAENVITAYNAIVNALPNHENNVKSLLLKMTMTAPVRVEGAQ